MRSCLFDMSHCVDLLLHLKTFVAVADELSFSRAADELAIAQPLLSRRIKSLEEFLGGELFDRARRQIRITDLGAALLPHARELLLRSDQLLDTIRAARGGSAVRLALPADCDPRALAGLLRAGAKHGVVLRIEELPAAARAAALADGSVGAALVAIEPDQAAIRVPLGIASAERLVPPGKAVQLDMLRTKRGSDAAQVGLLVTSEDADAPVEAAVRHAAARAGLPDEALRIGSASSAALAQTLAGGDVLLCDEQVAQRHGIPWAPLADGSICRGYRLAGSLDRAEWLLRLLDATLGAGEPPRRARDDDVMLAAHG